MRNLPLASKCKVVAATSTNCTEIRVPRVRSIDSDDAEWTSERQQRRQLDEQSRAFKGSHCVRVLPVEQPADVAGDYSIGFCDLYVPRRAYEMLNKHWCCSNENVPGEWGAG